MAPVIRFDRGARYGAAVVAMLFGTYLAIATDFSSLLQAENYAGTIRTDIPALNIVQFILILASFTTALSLLPTPVAGRVGGVTLTAVVLLLWATLGLERGVGNIVQPVALWSFLLNQGFIVLLASVGGWVIARGRHPLSWLVVAIAIVPPLVAPRLVAANFTSGGYALVIQGIVILGGLGAVWGAAAVDRALARRTERADAPASALS